MSRKRTRSGGAVTGVPGCVGALRPVGGLVVGQKLGDIYLHNSCSTETPTETAETSLHGGRCS
eukprot:scaffold76471_cov51-Phaeocystis_antarctica.AAC.1